MDPSSTHGLRKTRSEGCLKSMPERRLHHLCSMQEPVPPADRPLPPLLLRSASRPAFQAHSIDSIAASDAPFAVMQQTSASNSGSFLSKPDPESGSDSGYSSPRNTMLFHEQNDQNTIEFRLRSDSKKTPSLDDLGRLLELSSSLKETGTSFTQNGEMEVYGDPHTNADVEQMLRLGAEYDELWHGFFNGRSEVEQDLWPVLRALKRMLQNEGITFDDHHTRLSYGSAIPKLVRLSNEYDLLREAWFEQTLSDIHPALRWHRSPAQLEVPKTPIVMGWSFTKDKHSGDGLARMKSHRAERLTIVVEKQPIMHNGPDSAIQEASPPDTLGVAVDISVSIPIPARHTTTIRPNGLTIDVPVLLHGFSPLQSANAASMVLIEDPSDTQIASSNGDANGVLHRKGPRQHVHVGALNGPVEDERQRAGDQQWHGDEEQRRADISARQEGKSASGTKIKKRKGITKWLRTVFRLRKKGRQQQ